MFFYAMVVKIRKEVRGSMQDTKFHKITGAVVLILIIVIYSFYRMHDTALSCVAAIMRVNERD